MSAIRTAESASANESLREAHYETTSLSLGADAICSRRLRGDGAGAAGCDNYHGDSRSNDHGTDDDQRSLCHSGTAGGARGIANGFAGPELCLDARLLEMERHELRLGAGQLDRQAAPGRSLRRRPLAPAREPLGLDGRL